MEEHQTTFSIVHTWCYDMNRMKRSVMFIGTSVSWGADICCRFVRVMLAYRITTAASCSVGQWPVTAFRVANHWRRPNATCRRYQLWLQATFFYRAMHFSAYALSWDRMSSVCPSVRLSVTLVDCDHIGWKSWKLITRTTSPTPSLFVAKRRFT